MEIPSDKGGRSSANEVAEETELSESPQTTNQEDSDIAAKPKMPLHFNSASRGVDTGLV
ncbi:MAG: hypothetical protein ABGZ23_19990 [Fuerstiella sp.]